MNFLDQIKITELPTFIPKELLPSDPKFFVWYTGTLGQAEWLISHSNVLRGRAIPIPCPKTPNDFKNVIHWTALPNQIKPLLALEQPDLLISTIYGQPLISIEITEQQPVGLNAQQRMGRFWSAVANKIPCAYLLPIEGYQIETAPISAAQAFEEKDIQKRNLFLRINQIPELTIALVKRCGIETIDQLNEAIFQDSLDLETKTRAKLQDHVKKYMSQNTYVHHIQEVKVEDYVHKVGKTYYKAYIRKPGIPGSMLLKWFEICNNFVSAAAFQLPVSYKNLFRSNGRVHTMNDEQNPHLSYRNLPPAPGTFPPINERLNIDEISLFFKMVNNTLLKIPLEDLGRKELTEPGVFFSNQNEEDQQIRITLKNQFDEYKSKDILAEKSILEELLLTHLKTLQPELRETLADFKVFNIYKIYCAAAERSLADPYTGALATRDILFTRNLEIDDEQDLFAFKRLSGLVFWVDLIHAAATRHKFFIHKVQDVYNAHCKLKENISIQEKIIQIISEVSAENVPKDIRGHLLFSDLIVVRRMKPEGPQLEVCLGVPALLRRGAIDKNSKFLASLQI